MKFLYVAVAALALSSPGWASAAKPAGQSSELKSALLDVYLESARVQDLLSLARPDNWKITAEQRSEFSNSAGLLQDQLRTLEKWRYQLLYHQDDAAAAQKTLDALTALIPQIRNVAALVSRGESPAAGAQYQKTADDFQALAARLQSELAARFPGKFAAEAQPQPQSPKPESAIAAAERPKAPASESAAAQPARSTSSPAPPTETAAAANPPATRPGTTTSINTAPAPPPAAQSVQNIPAGQALPPAQVKALLQNVFLASARVSDLLSIAQPEKWKMSLPERSLFNEKIHTVRAELETLEKERYDFFYHPDSVNAGECAVQALTALGPDLKAVAPAIAQYQSPSDAAQFSKAATALLAPGEPLASYVDYLRNRRQQQLAAAQSALLAGAKGLQVERIAPRTLPAPITTPIPIATPPLTPAQVKAILYKIYISYYRIRDLLSQERPAQWKAPQAERVLASQARDALLSRLQNVEKWRSAFSESPENVYYGFETYVVVSDVLHPLWLFSREASRRENATVGADYSRRAADLDAQLHLLLPYFRFVLKRDQEGYGQYEADLANCQTQLGYAMHGFIHQAAPIRNVVPEFEGRRARKRKKRRGDK
ncbi:MAG: hypothetical protein ACRD1N_08165 [Terriglobia bacterium]